MSGMRRTNIFLGVALPSVVTCFEFEIMQNGIDASWFRVVSGALIMADVLIYNDTCQKMFTSGIYWWKMDEELAVLELADKKYVRLFSVYLLTGLLFCVVMRYTQKPFWILLSVVKFVLMVYFWNLLRKLGL